MAKLKEIIGEELFNKLSDEKKKEYENQDLRDVSDGKFVDKEKFNQVNQQVKDYKKQVTEIQMSLQTRCYIKHSSNHNLSM